MTFVPLHVHSQYSILDASAPIADLAKRAAAYQMPALALTDHGNLFGAVEFFKACKDAKVKPIIGCEFFVAPLSRFDKNKSSHEKTSFHLILLAKDDEGYHNLCKLSSIGYLEGFYFNPRIDKEVLEKHSKGLICLSGCMNSSVAYLALKGNKEELYNEISWYKNLFKDDYYLELARHKMSEQEMEKDRLEEESWAYQNYLDHIEKQEKVNKILLQASSDLDIKCVATNDTHYMDQEDWKAHEILLNIASGDPCEIWLKDSLGNPTQCVPNPKRRTYPSHAYYFKSPEAMQILFQDIPHVLVNTLEVADKCRLDLDFKTKHYPVYIPPSLEGRQFTKETQAEEAASYLKYLCDQGLSLRYTQERLNKVALQYPGKDPKEVILQRLAYEMDLIVSKGMCDYLLIVYDFINWAKVNGIPMGPGRGSGAGSIICYLIGITDIEPLRFKLFFERFINPERISYPDIDVDICMERRGEVIEYTLNKYGKDNVAQIITFGTMKAKMAIRDVGRVLSIPLAKVNQIAKLVPEDPNMTLEKALEIDPELYKLYMEDAEANRIIQAAKKLEGSIRNTGIHAAGLIICADPIVNHVPVCVPKESSMAATQYSMKPVELVGMLKIDFLGLKTLTSIQKAVDYVENNHGIKIDWVNLDLEDPPTFNLLNQGKTLGVFQMESGGMQELAKNLHLDKFEEIIAVLSLYRPGPMDMIPSFINRKHGREAIDYDHPLMEEILRETYGIMVYQEQVMEIARKLASYSLGEGDVLRRAMGKKDMAEMTRQRTKFTDGAKLNGIDERVAGQVFDKMEKFAAYGFNKSHAAAYGYLTFVTAFLKAHYPKEWMAALMTCDRDDLTKVAKFIRECDAMGIPILPPDINEAGLEFKATTAGIRFAMTGIKGIGQAVVEAIIEERNKGGAFTSLYNFLKRIDTKRVGKKAIESLIDAGSFDFTKWNRDSLVMGLEPMYESSVKEQKESSLGIMTLFSLLGEDDEKRFAEPPLVLVKRSNIELLVKEKELLGFFLTGHPMDAYKDILRQLSTVPLHEIEHLDHDAVFRAAFILESVEVRIAHKTQKKFAICTISDGDLRYEMPVWSELYEEKASLLRENQLLYAVLQVDKKEETPRITCRFLEDLTKVDQNTINACDAAYDKAKIQISRALQLKEKGAVNKPPPVKKMEPVNLSLNLNEVKLSHILKLKEVFRAYRGSSPIILNFEKEGIKIAFLMIDKAWGVNNTPEFKKQINGLSFVSIQ